MLNKLFILVILSILSIIIIKVYHYFKKVEEFNNLRVTGKYGKICQSKSKSKVYSCGRNNYGKLGFDSKTRYETKPQLIGTFNDAITITQIAGGLNHSLFLTNEGHVYSCGSNYLGQLGLNSTDNKTTPQLIKKYYDSDSNSINYDEITITQIACSYYHSLFLTNDGHVYSCGRNNKGQLGLNSTDNKTTPQLIQKYYDSDSNSINYDAIKITKIACGASHSLFLTNEGRVYSCGWNYYGQLGLNSTEDETTPQLIGTFNDAIMITQIAGSGKHSLFLTNDGHVYSCGSNYLGQLGLNSTYNKTTPQLIQNYYDSSSNSINYDAIMITQIACGSNYSLFLTNEGHVYSCGSNYLGQLGLNSTDNETTPQLIQKYYDSSSNSINYDAIKITQIACGYQHTFINNIHRIIIVS